MSDLVTLPGSRQELTPLLERHLSNLDEEISEAFHSLDQWFRNLDQQIGTNFSKRLRYSTVAVQADWESASSASDNGGWQETVSGLATITAIGASVASFFTGGLAPVLAWGGSWIAQMFQRNPEEIQSEIRDQVLKQGFKHLQESKLKIQSRIEQQVKKIFQERSAVVQKRIGDAISATQNILEQTQKASSASRMQKQQIIDWIDLQTEFLSQHSQIIRHFMGDCANSPVLSDVIKNVAIPLRSGETKPQLDKLTDAEVEAILEQRRLARQAKNWAEADRIRNELQTQGITLIDQANGATH